VQKLREKEAGEGKQIILSKGGDGRVSMSAGDFNDGSSTFSRPHRPSGAGGRHLEDIEGSIDLNTHTYPPGYQRTSLEAGVSITRPYLLTSSPFRSSLCVVDRRRRTNGAARWERVVEEARGWRHRAATRQ
jgi:phospholipid-translocating ATPase